MLRVETEEQYLGLEGLGKQIIHGKEQHNLWNTLHSTLTTCRQPKWHTESSSLHGCDFWLHFLSYLLPSSLESKQRLLPPAKNIRESALASGYYPSHWPSTRTNLVNLFTKVLNPPTYFPFPGIFALISPASPCLLISHSQYLNMLPQQPSRDGNVFFQCLINHGARSWRKITFVLIATLKTTFLFLVPDTLPVLPKVEPTCVGQCYPPDLTSTAEPALLHSHSCHHVNYTVPCANNILPHSSPWHLHFQGPFFLL